MNPTIIPTVKQDKGWKIFKDKKVKFFFFGGGAGGGKTWLGCEWLLTNCYFFPGSRWFIGRKEIKRLMQSTFVTWGKVTRHHNIPEGNWNLNGKYNYIEFFNGSRIDLLDLDYLPSDPDYERFGSLEYTGGWIEEAGEIHFMAFDILKSRIGRHLNKELEISPKMFITGNPSKNWSYRVFYLPWEKGELPEDYAFVQSLYQDNIHTSEIYGEQLKTITDKATKERLMFGNWHYDDDPATLMSYDSLVDLFSNKVKEGEDYLTADIARFGQDKTVVMIWNGLRVVKIYTYVYQDTATTGQKINKILQDQNIPRSHAVIDEDGIGGSVVDNLKGVRGFIANKRPLPNRRTNKIPNYANLKSQASYLLAKLVNRKQVAIETKDEKVREMIIEELEQIKGKDIDKDGKVQIQPKSKVKEMIGRSPDYGDNLVMRMLFELKRPVRKQQSMSDEEVEAAIDIY